MSFPRYPKYKESGVEWLGQVPEHWEVVQLKQLLEIQNGADHKLVEQEEGYPVIGSGGVFAYACDFLYDGESVLLGRKGTIDKPLHVSGRFWTVDTMYWTKIKPEASGRFAYYTALTIPFSFYSTNTALPSMTKGNLSSHLVSRPHFTEQTAIADFLDQETAKIDVLIAEQERLIELLKEKRQAVISHAVTKGLNPDSPMKDSGIEWLGQVPKHWEVSPLGRVTIDRCDGPFGSGLKSEHYTDSGARVIRLQNIRREGFDGTDEAYIDFDYYQQELQGHDVISGDVLIAGLGDEKNTVGRACIAPDDIEPALVKADCFRFRVDRSVSLSRFIATALCASATHDSGTMSSGSTRSRIPLSAMATRKIPLPPLSEQKGILDFLEQETGKIDDLTAEAQKAITLLQERRSALISAAVTGQIDVRGFQHQEAA
jgi:type I restriction enzyme S subunit